MEHLIEGVRDAIRKESWYAALALALALPDTCASVDDPGKGKSKKRYEAWVDNYVSKHFRSKAPVIQFMTSEDLYQLRCSFLHEGDFDVEPDRAPSNNIFSVLNRVALYVSDHEMVPARMMTETQSGNPSRSTAYSVAVKDLCEWICQGVEEWLPLAKKDSAKVTLLDKLGRITVWRNFTMSVL